MDIQHILDHARDQLLTFGHVNPIFFIESGEEIMLVPAVFAHKPDILDQCRVLMHVAWDLMVEHHAKKLESIIFCSTAVVGEITEGAEAFSYEKAGAKREILLVERWQKREPARTSYLLPVHRLKTGEVQMVQTPLESHPSLSYQLTVFFHSLLLAQVVLSVPTKERVAVIYKYVYGLSPKERGELLHFLTSVGDLESLP